MIVLPRRLSDEVADRVRALIDEKNLEAGMKLPAERQLAMQLGGIVVLLPEIHCRSPGVHAHRVMSLLLISLSHVV